MAGSVPSEDLMRRKYVTMHLRAELLQRPLLTVLNTHEALHWSEMLPDPHNATLPVRSPMPRPLRPGHINQAV